MNSVRFTSCTLVFGLLAACSAGPRGETAVLVDTPFPVVWQEAAAEPYTPAPHPEWQRRPPARVGMDPVRLQHAVNFAVQNETGWPTDLRAALEESLATGEYGEIVGPVKDRGGQAGVIVKDGYLVAEWGDLERVDMTFSVTKSYLSTTAGLALDSGLIAALHDPVVSYAPGIGFEGRRNSSITWHMLLNQTSEWRGDLWGKPDVADRREGKDRELQPPGTFWEYNDVRVNQTAFALLHLWNEPLPGVLEELVMDRIGASGTWTWHGYQNSYLELDGERVQSVSGGGHWGGGMWINTLDQARFGLLFLRGGEWEDREILSPEWVEMATTPTGIKPVYGYMWWLNTGRQLYPSAPESSFFALGAGSNVIWIDPDHDLVAVLRWIDGQAVDGFIERVLAALEP
ncbi:MAG: serine hydrolase domain-containing protein [Longimicrobiaceae bacterium]